jgi:hypothetical protein
MTNTNMTPEQENACYAEPDKQVPEGPPARRSAKLNEPVPLRFPEELLSEIRNRAAADDRSVPTGSGEQSNANSLERSADSRTSD